MDSKGNNKNELSGKEQLKRITSSLDELKQIAADRVSPDSVIPEIKKELEEIKIPTSLLEKVETESDSNSLLSREA